MSIEVKVKRYYAREGMAEAILSAARKTAKDPDNLTTADLALFDEMHIGGRPASEHFISRLRLSGGMKILDIGSGLGSVARYVAETTGAEVTGLDLTPDFTVAAKQLSTALKLDDKTAFVTGSALELPFDSHGFDCVYSVHAAMNIADKPGLFREAARVLKPGGLFGCYDVLSGPDRVPLTYPLPWADSDETGFLDSLQERLNTLTAAGFEILHKEERSAFALTMLAKMQELERSGELPERPYPLRSENFPERIRNLVHNLEQGLCGPWVIIGRKI